MRKILAVVVVFALACAGGDGTEATEAISAAEPAALEGTWGFYESCGETAGGTGIGIGYSLHISGTQATLDADGFQTMLRAAASVESGEDGVSKLVFSHLREEGSGAYLSPGDVMLTFTVEDGDLMVEPDTLLFACTEATLFTRDGG